MKGKVELELDDFLEMKASKDKYDLLQKQIVRERLGIENKRKDISLDIFKIMDSMRRGTPLDINMLSNLRPATIKAEGKTFEGFAPQI